MISEMILDKRNSPEDQELIRTNKWKKWCYQL